MPKGNKGAAYALESKVAKMLDIYRVRGDAIGVKMDPPLKAFRGKVPIYGENHFVDFTGCRKGGHMFHLEVKRTSGGTLAIDRPQGVTRKQIQNMAKWSDFGASCAVLWESERHGYQLIPGVDVFTSFVEQMPSIRHDIVYEINVHMSGEGEALPDFLSQLT